jgi:hypothetical protein
LGLFLPFIFKQLGIDPAISSGPLVSTINDWKSARKWDPDRHRKRTHLGPTIRRPRAASRSYFPFRVLFFFTDSRNR